MTAKSSFRSPRAWLLAAASVAALGTLALQPAAAQQAASPVIPAEIANGPLYAAIAGDRPTITLVPSVEFPTAGMQYIDEGTYNTVEDFIGYYNHEMCYEYNTKKGYFEIKRKGTIRAGEKGARCGGDKEFSGNFLNWATSGAMDIMRLALTGGDRVEDTKDLTVLQRTYLPDGTAQVSGQGPGCFFKRSAYFPVRVIKKTYTYEEKDKGIRVEYNNYADALPKDMVEARAEQGRHTDGSNTNTIYVGNIGDRIHFGVHAMGGTNENCTFGPYSYALGAGGQVNDFHYARKNAFFPTSKHDSCANGATCTADGDGQRVWYGDGKEGHQWITGIVEGSFKCGGDIFKNANRHGDTGETITPFDNTSKCYLEDEDANLSGNTPFFYARVKVCDALDERDYTMCTEYPNGKKKPTGVIQKYSDNLRLSVFGYAIDHTASYNSGYNGRFGGLLRAPMKYVGPTTYSPTGQKLTDHNPRAEWDSETGEFIRDPEGLYASGASKAGMVYPNTANMKEEDKVSGVINYFNRFGRNPNQPGAYKQFDPVAELYYEALRYLQGLGPTPQAVSNLTDYMIDGFPAYTSWDGLDPFRSELGYSKNTDYTCLKNSVLIVGDVNTHDTERGDGRLRYTLKEGQGASDGWDAAKNIPDAHFWRDVVRGFETTTQKSYKDGSGVKRTTSNPFGANFNWSDGGIYRMSILHGLAYWAHTHDIRSADWTVQDDKQRPGLRITTYTFDVNENSSETPYSKRKSNNQYWLAAKYGGFKTQPDGDGDTAYNTHGNPFYGTTESGGTGAANKLVWSDLVKAQGSNTDGEANPEPRTYYMPSNARGVLKAFDDIFGATKPPSQRSIGGADSIGGLGGTSYQATFNGSTWAGDLIAESIVQEGGNDRKVQKWCASNVLASTAPSARNIIMGSHDPASGTKAYEFTANALPPDVMAALEDSEATADDRIAWLRGDQSKEQPNGGLRTRGVSDKDCPQKTASVLGDIINSGVKYVGPPSGAVNLGAGFDAYVDAQAGRRGMVYVGANDGMLHAFAAEDGGGVKGGSELFAYIPSWMRDKLAALTAPNYIHQNYVDATPVIGDAVIKTNPTGNANDWATVLVGGTGGGGKGVFALDVTDPTKFTKNSVLWEFTDADDPDMGYVLGQVRIVKLLYRKASGNVAGSSDTYRWFAMVPAGVNNYVPRDAETATADDVGNGNANIFLLALDKPASAKWAEKSNYWKLELPRIEALDATHPSGILNLEAFTGLGGVTEYVYAGDLHGQLWALSFKGMAHGDWTPYKLSNLYNNGSTIKPLYIAQDEAGNPQPITVAPTILEGAGNGVHFVSFGTGKYFELSDSFSKQPNTFYTVYSNFNSVAADFGSRTGDAVIAGRSALEQVNINDEASTAEATYFKPDSEFFWGWKVADTPTRIRSGWYHDFDGSGEREVADASWISQTSRLMFSTLTPNAANETGVCGTGGGDSRVYTFDMVSGKGFRKVSPVGLLAQPLVFFDFKNQEETAADSTGRRLRITPVLSGQFGAEGSSVQQVETVIVPYGRLSWRRIDNFQELKNEEVK